MERRAACFLASCRNVRIFAMRNRRVHKQEISYQCDEGKNKYTKNQSKGGGKQVRLTKIKA
ncbi:hypothetical protein AEL96_12180, partial [Lactobacillus crispatus]